jgi:protein O-GlcNAc transferase
LDAFPCTGGVTTCESLWMGAPVLTLCGVRPAGRNSAALLARVGLNDWTVNSAEEYVSRAIQCDNDLLHLARLRKDLRERVTTTLCDAQKFTHELEDTFRAMWHRWCEKEGKGQEN